MALVLPQLPDEFTYVALLPLLRLHDANHELAAQSACWPRQMPISLGIFVSPCSRELKRLARDLRPVLVLTLPQVVRLAAYAHEAT